MTSGTIPDLVTANHILANEGVLDAFGHVSVRHPDHADRFVMSRALAPELVTQDDLQTYDRAGELVESDPRTPYVERFIHAAVYGARPDVHAIVHHHAPGSIPFGVTGTPLRAMIHVAGMMGSEVPVWDIVGVAGDGTDLLVRDFDVASSLASELGNGSSVLMRGHGGVAVAGSLREVVHLTIYSEQNARLQLAAMQLGTPTFLSTDEAAAAAAAMASGGPGRRGWEVWSQRVGVLADRHS